MFCPYTCWFLIVWFLIIKACKCSCVVSTNGFIICKDEAAGGMGASPRSLESLPFRRAKTAVKCSFAGQLTGHRIICSMTVLLIKICEFSQNFRNFLRAHL